MLEVVRQHYASVVDLQRYMPLLVRLQSAASPAASRALTVLQPYVERYEPCVRRVLDRVDLALSPYRPWQILLAATLITLAVVNLLLWFSELLEPVRHMGLMQWSFNKARGLPYIRDLIEREQRKVKSQIAEKLRKGGDDSLTQLPTEGASTLKVLEQLKHRERLDIKIAEGCSPLSGAVYIGSEAHKRFLDEAYALFSWTNPLHADSFPSVRKMEAEVVAMTAAMLGGGPQGNLDVCGAMTSGGTESILLAIKAARDHARAHRGVSRPEMVVANSAHAAYWKAAEYFNIRLVILPVGKDYRLSGERVRRALSRNTVLVVASAPCFPHGVVDHVEDIARVTRRAGVLLHVDACLGGFVLPFARKLGYAIPAFDFSVPGVTSMSVDTHKFAMAHKGTSVVLYHHPSLRRHQYTCITEWTGGLYISPTMAGSRSGALIATAWASMISMGEKGYLDLTDKVMEAARQFEEGLRGIPDLELVGRPDMSVVAFRSTNKQLNIYKLNDLLTKKGWHLNALQGPPSLHFCFTAAHVSVTELLLTDLAAAVRQLKADPNCVQGGAAPLYGLSSVSPDRGIVGEFLIAYQDVMLQP